MDEAGEGRPSARTQVAHPRFSCPWKTLYIAVMSMESSISGSATLETQDVKAWLQAATHFDNGEFHPALLQFHTALEYVPTAKLNFNIAQCHLNLGSIEDAISALSVALQQDPFLAVAYCQRGVCYYQFCDWARAAKDFGNCVQALRGNMVIDYAQLGLAYRLYACEPTYNLALANFCLRNTALALTTLQSAEKLLPLLDRPREYYANVDKALKLGQGCEGDLDLYMCPLRCIYRPIKARTIHMQNASVRPSAANSVASNPPSNSVTTNNNPISTNPVNEKQDKPSPNHSQDVSGSDSTTSFVEKELKAAAQLLSSLKKSPGSVQVKSVDKCLEDKKRISLHLDADIFTISISHSFTFVELRSAILKKTGLKTVSIKWRDEEDRLITLVDDEDLDLFGQKDKIELWVA